MRHFLRLHYLPCHCQAACLRLLLFPTLSMSKVLSCILDNMTTGLFPMDRMEFRRMTSHCTIGTTNSLRNLTTSWTQRKSSNLEHALLECSTTKTRSYFQSNFDRVRLDKVTENWKPFSMRDSMALEECYQADKNTSVLVSLNFPPYGCSNKIH